jgi:hypothetical protein
MHTQDADFGGLARIIHRGLVFGGFCLRRAALFGGAGGARAVGAWVTGDGFGRGTRPRRSGRQLGGAGRQQHEAVPVVVAGRQGDLDPGGELGDPRDDLDQREAEGVELGVAPERGLGRQAAQRVQQPVGRGVDQEPELVGRGLGA